MCYHAAIALRFRFASEVSQVGETACPYSKPISCIAAVTDASCAFPASKSSSRDTTAATPRGFFSNNSTTHGVQYFVPGPSNSSVFFTCEFAMALQPAPHLGDSYWATTAQLLAADAAESDEELTRNLTSDTNTLSSFASSAVPPPAKNNSSADTTTPRTDADDLETAMTEITTNGRAVVTQARRMRDCLKVRRLYYRKLVRPTS